MNYCYENIFIYNYTEKTQKNFEKTTKKPNEKTQSTLIGSQ